MTGKTLKILNLGISGAGKTVFLSSVINNLLSPINSRYGVYVSQSERSPETLFRDSNDMESLDISRSISEGNENQSHFPSNTKWFTTRSFRSLLFCFRNMIFLSELWLNRDA